MNLQQLYTSLFARHVIRQCLDIIKMVNSMYLMVVFLIIESHLRTKSRILS